MLPGIVTLTLVAYASSGCLANHYRIDRTELERLTTLPPASRGAGVRVVQALGSNREPGLYHRPPPPPPSPSPLPQADTRVSVEVDVDIAGPFLRGTSRRSREMIRTAPTRTRSGHVSGWGGDIGNVGPSSGGGGNNDAMVVVAVLLIAVALFAVAGLAVSEGLRFEGEVAVPPYQPIHLENQAGLERVVSLWDLQLGDLDPAVSATMIEGEAQPGPAYLVRAPLDRRGATFKVDIGGLSTVLDDWTITGVASNIQLGYFFHQRYGLLANLSLGLASDPFDKPLARHSLGIEAQGFPVDFGRLHLGAYLGGGRLLSTDANDNFVTGPSFGAGALVEVALTTRLALMVRGGWTFAGISGHNWFRTGTVTAGLAIY